MWSMQRERKRIEAVVLAVLSISAVLYLRYPLEAHWLLIGEVVALFACALPVLVFTFRSQRAGRPVWSQDWWYAAAILAPPVLSAIVGRIAGQSVANEMVALSVSGAAALALAILASSDRVRGMSLVSSGFLVLFTTSISDHSQSVAFAVVWMVLCVWHLVANHWERLELCAADTVHRRVGIRPLTVCLAVTLCLIGGLSVKNRFGNSSRLLWGFMPTSGGSSWSDPSARSGVGDGDAAIAAKDHADSFGAVESELFLESTQSTLFDMFSDTMGPPKRVKKWERRQSIASADVQESHQRLSKSEKGGRSFSTDRLPPKQHRKLSDAVGNAVVQWAGPSGIRLAMQRYDTFDGVDWTNTADQHQDRLARRQFGDAVWFLCPTRASEATEVAPEVGLLKVLRLDSTRIPTPMMTAGLHIKDVDRQDFFAVDKDGSWVMPGRDQIPPLTVFNVASIPLMEDQLCRLTTTSTVEWSTVLSSDVQQQLSGLVREWVRGHDTPYEQLGSVIAHLRSDFTFDRQASSGSGDPIGEFLHKRRGGDHLFATVAALMARELGLQARLVSGFYVRPSAIDLAAGHTNVLPTDVHTWVEIKLDPQRWFEVEPTPGYQPPRYRPSPWLSAQRFAGLYWPVAAGGLLVLGTLYMTRLIWLEWLLVAVWSLSRLWKPRRRLALAMRIVETRAWLVGHARPVGRPQRDWLLELSSLTQTTGDQRQRLATQFCDLADRHFFGQSIRSDRTATEHHTMGEFVSALRIRSLKTRSPERIG